MTINYNDKIKKIDEDRILMLKAVKENMSKNNITLFNNLNNVISKLNEDEANTKKYKSIVKAKEFIFELTEQIVNANSIEEITKLRKKINYYINKIKKELATRNTEQESFDNLYNNVDYLRSDITRYISFLKRETNITIIKKLYGDVGNLTPDSISQLKKLLSNEAKYNKNFMTTINNCSKNIKKESPISTDKIVSKNEENLSEKKEGISPKTNLSDLTNHNLEKNVQLRQSDEQLSIQNVAKKTEDHLSIYEFSEISSYDGKLLKRIFAFLKNIPKYRFNKKIIRKAEHDYNVYYHGDDLAGFINYFKRYNSIQLALELIFRKSSLSKKEIEYLFNHNKCVDWINEFYNQRNNVLYTDKKLIKSK